MREKTVHRTVVQSSPAEGALNKSVNLNHVSQFAEFGSLMTVPIILGRYADHFFGKQG